MLEDMREAASDVIVDLVAEDMACRSGMSVP